MLRVLNADDSRVLRRALRRAVEGLGHGCREAADGEAALGDVVRHAAANEVVVRVAAGPDGRLCVTVRDDGQGFDPPPRRLASAPRRSPPAPPCSAARGGSRARQGQARLSRRRSLSLWERVRVRA